MHSIQISGFRTLPAFLLLSFILIGSPYHSLIAQTSFDDFKQQYEDEFAAFSQTFETGVAQTQQEYKAYQEAIKKELEAFKKTMEQQWGAFDERTKKQWVEYKKTGEIKYKVDFETGEASVEVLAENNEEVEEARNNMARHLVQALKDQGTPLGIPTEKIPEKTVHKEPVLADQIDKNSSETDQQYAERIASERTQTKKVTGKDGRERTVVYLNFDLAPNHIRTRAEKVSDPVYRFAKEYKLDPALVFAIIHTESYFNPMAVSPANAYGLMQLVPQSGGRDAYRAVFNKDGIPTQQFLFKSENNVNLGCAYVDILINQYLKGVENPITRQYLAIAAYNTGAGNVARAYTGNTSVSAALDAINRRSTDDNYHYLIEHLPYRETRDYLQKVVERSEDYADMKE